MSGNLGYYVEYFPELPKEWRTIRLDENVICILPGYAFKSCFFEEFKGTPLIRVRDVGKGKTEISYDGDFDRKYIAQKNDILVGMDGEYLVSKWDGPNALLNQRVCKIESLDENFLDKDFLYYVIKNPIKKIEMQTPQTTVKHLSTKDIRKIRVPLPPISEQQKIAFILSTVDEAIQKTDEVIEKTQILKRGLMQRVLTRGIGYTKFKRTKLGEIPEEWELLRLGDRGVCKIKYGKAKPKSEGNIPVIGSAGIYDYTGEYLVDPPVLVVGRKGNAGAVYLCKQRCWPSDTTFYVKIVNPKLKPDFLFSILATRKILGERAKTTLPSLTVDFLSDQIIPVPPLPEQQKIALILSSVDDNITKEKQRKQQLEQVKKGLMQVLLTGKVRVKVD